MATLQEALAGLNQSVTTTKTKMAALKDKVNSKASKQYTDIELAKKSDKTHTHSDSLVFDATANTLTYKSSSGESVTYSLLKYLDNNTAALASASYDAPNKRLVFTREDGSSFSVDTSVFFDDTNLVMSVNGKTGVISLSKADIGLSSVDNTSDSTKNVLSATKLTTARTIGTSGDVTGTATSFNGTDNITIPLALATTGVTAGTYKQVTVDVKGRVTAGSNPAAQDDLVLDSAANTLTLTKTDGTTKTVSLLKYLDNNTSALASASYDATNKRLVFTREDGSSFSVDTSVFFDDTNLVMSVNDKTGAVTLTAADVGALPSTQFVPTIHTGATVNNATGVNGDLFLVV